MIQLAVIVGRSMTGGGPTGDRARRIILPLLIRLPGLHGQVLNSATPALPASSLNDRGRFGRGLPGTLCPNVLLESGARLDDLTGYRFTLVTRNRLSGRAAQRLAALDITVVSTKAAPDLDRWLGRAQAALVRPDRTVLAAGRLDTVLRRIPLCRPSTTSPKEKAL